MSTIEFRPGAEAVAGEAERRELRETLRSFLDIQCPETRTRAGLDGEQRYDDAVWRRLCGELGLLALAVPVRWGGFGFGWQELGIALEELGRVVYPGPFFSNTIGSLVLQEIGGENALDSLLPSIAAGEVQVTVACADGLDFGLNSGGELSCTPVNRGAYRIDGTLSYVIDAATADFLLLLCVIGSQPRLLSVPLTPEHTTATPHVTMDLTRPLVRLEFRGALAQDIGDGAVAGPALGRLDAKLGLALAAEQLGGASRALEITVEYVRNRVQFGRTIGSFQAVKHRCSEMLVAVEGARATCNAGLAAADSGADDLLVQAHLAAATCSDAYFEVARGMVQLHGGIGFTWEHVAHLYLKRAKSSQLLFGPAHRHRKLIATQLGLARDMVQES